MLMAPAIPFRRMLLRLDRRHGNVVENPALGHPANSPYRILYCCACRPPEKQRTHERGAITGTCLLQDDRRHAPSMAAMSTVFTSQSPEWIAAIFHGVSSHMMAPTHIIAEKPNHSHRASCAALFTSATPIRAITRASTKVMMSVRAVSTTTFAIDGSAPAVAPGSIARQILPSKRGL